MSAHQARPSSAFKVTVLRTALSTSLFAISIGIVITLFSYRLVNSEVNQLKNAESIRASIDAKFTAAISEEMKSIEGIIKNTPISSSDTPVSNKLKELEIRINDLKNKLDSLNAVILESPEKALSIPMLRKDIVTLRAQHDQSVTSLQSELRNTFDIFQWALGTVFLGILGLIVSVSISSKQSTDVKLKKSE